MPNLIVLSTLVFLSQAGDDGRIDSAQFARVLAGLHAPIRDFELICEGEYRLVDQKQPDWAERAKARDMILQSNFAFRADGRAILDSYEKLASDNAAMSHRTYLLVGDDFESRTLAGDVKPSHAASNKRGGGWGSIDHKNGSPGRFNFLLFWNRHLARYPDLPGYRWGGWEQVDGKECLKVSVDGSPEAPGSEELIFWIDMKRGGHALKQEMRNNGSLWFRKHSIELAKFALPDGKPVWFPVRGEYDTFTSAQGASETPIFHEVEAVVQGSLALNQNLPDERFSLDWHGRPKPAPGFAALSGQFERIPKKPVEPVRRDLNGVQADQEKRLAEVDRESIAMDASAGSQRHWLGTTTVQALLTGVGIVVLVLAYLLKPRS